jgi:hypothetical protein
MATGHRDLRDIVGSAGSGLRGIYRSAANSLPFTADTRFGRPGPSGYDAELRRLDRVSVMAAGERDAGSPGALLAVTASWIAAVRAQESRRPDHLLDDPWAAQLADAEVEEWLPCPGRQPGAGNHCGPLHEPTTSGL